MIGRVYLDRALVRGGSCLPSLVAEISWEDSDACPCAWTAVYAPDQDGRPHPVPGSEVVLALIAPRREHERLWRGGAAYLTGYWLPQPHDFRRALERPTDDGWKDSVRRKTGRGLRGSLARHAIGEITRGHWAAQDGSGKMRPWLFGEWF